MLNASSAKDFALDVLNGTEAWCFLEVMFFFPWFMVGLPVTMFVFIT